jgi:hypothetical protein
MTDWIFKWFSAGSPLPEGSREWMLQGEGISAGWAFLAFLIMAAASIWAHSRYAAGLTLFKRGLLIFLRMAAMTVFLILLVQPVLNLTLHEPVRQSLLVLIDSSQSMLLGDQRSTPDDQKRAAIAAGLIDPTQGLKPALPPEARALDNANRWDLLEKLAANTKLNLWRRLAEKSDLLFYRFGRDIKAAGQATAEKGNTPGNLDALLHKVFSNKPEEPSSALGESLREVLEQNRGLPIGGILLVTDGANNSGLPPVEAARMARVQNIPLFLYGIGVTSPVDLVVKSLNGPQIGFVKERVDVVAKLHVQGIGQRRINVVLKADGKEVDTQPFDLRENGDFDVSFRYEPPEAGDVLLEASVAPINGEITKANNAASAKIRIVDKKIKVLYIEQEPRWDFRYLLAYLQRDRRLEVKCVLIDSEPGLQSIPNSPFLPGLPEDREDFFKNEIIIFGDVSPSDLGETRMKMISEWVAQANGGIIFLAGMKNNPSRYAGTPLEILLPVVPEAPETSTGNSPRSLEPFKLLLTPAGEKSPYLRMSADQAENLRIWGEFPGVRWTAPVAKAKPGATILLADTRTERAVSGQTLPVMAVQSYGSGESVYIGTDETYRWRSRMGEKYYSQVWSSIIQSISLKRIQGASSRTQIKADRERYLSGDKVVISGKIYREGFEASTAASIPGRIEVTLENGNNPQGKKTIPTELTAVADLPGEYRAEFTAGLVGKYSFSTLEDPGAKVEFQVIKPNLEQMDTALNEPLLKAMAETSNGHFLREEDLDQLPGRVVEQGATVTSFKKIELFHSPWWMGLIFFFLFLEWLVRRLSHLK